MTRCPRVYATKNLSSCKTCGVFARQFQEKLTSTALVLRTKVISVTRDGHYVNQRFRISGSRDEKSPHCSKCRQRKFFEKLSTVDEKSDAHKCFKLQISGSPWDLAREVLCMGLSHHVSDEGTLLVSVIWLRSTSCAVAPLAGGSRSCCPFGELGIRTLTRR